MKTITKFAAVLSIAALVGSASAQDVDVSLVVEISGTTYEERVASLEKLEQEVVQDVFEAQKEAADIQAEADKLQQALERAQAEKEALVGDIHRLEKLVADAKDGSPLHISFVEKEKAYDVVVDIVSKDPSDENLKKKLEARDAFLAASAAFNYAVATAEQEKGVLKERYKLTGENAHDLMTSRVLELQTQIADLRTQVSEAEGVRAAKKQRADVLLQRKALIASEHEKLDRKQDIAVGMNTNQAVHDLLAESQKGNTKLDGIGKLTIEVRDEIKEVNTNLVSIQKQNLEELKILGAMKVEDESVNQKLNDLIKIVREKVIQFPNDRKTQEKAAAVIQEVKKVTAPTPKPASQPVRQQAQPVRNPAVSNSSASYAPPRAQAPTICLDRYGRPIYDQSGQPVTNCQSAWYSGN